MDRIAGTAFLLLIATLVGACATTEQERAGRSQAVAVAEGKECTFKNPVAPGQDPWVVRQDGWYYLIESRDNALYVYRSRELTDLKKNPVKVWETPEEGWNQDTLWAPELHYIDGRWYIYYAAGRSGPPFIHQRSGVLQSVGSDPQGNYEDKGQLYTGDDIASRSGNIWSIDLTVEEIDGQLYGVWSGWKENQPDDATPQHLYIAEMSNPWTISSNRVRISSPVEVWEDGEELDINEGPTFLKHDGETFILYSARESWLPAYQMGQLRLKRGADPMKAGSWVKRGPVFSGTEHVHGVGHASFTTSPDGTQPWIVYHTKKDTTPGWDRVIHAQPFEWERGRPEFDEPVPAGKPVPVPSGQGGCN